MPKKTTVKKHDRFVKGRRVPVIKHERMLQFIPNQALNAKIKNLAKTDPIPFNKRNMNIFHLPIETVVYIPSTTENQKLLSPDDFEKRVAESQDELAKMFGGYSTVDVQGGYEDDDGNIIKEKVAKVTVFTTEDNLVKQQRKYRQWLLKNQKQWYQDSIGFEVEGDLYYLKKPEKKKKVK